MACFEYYAGLGEKLDGSREQPVDVGDAAFRSYVRKEPLGVVAAISAWNYPLLLAAVRLCALSHAVSDRKVLRLWAV